MKTALWILTLVLIVVMPTQWGFQVGGVDKPITREHTETLPNGTKAVVTEVLTKHEGGLNVTPGDALLAAIFIVWAVYAVVTFRMFEVRMPFFAAFVFVAVLLASALHSEDRGSGLREAVQAGAYFIGGWLVFANCINTRERLRAAVGVFTLVVAAVVVLALYQYHAAAHGGNVFKIGGTFGNRNVLGAFLAITLPFVFALALYEQRILQSFALLLTVAVGAMVTLSGGALIALAVALLFMAALKSRKAVFGVVLAILLAVTILPGVLHLPRHTDVVVSSVNPYLGNNWLDWREGEPESREAVGAARYKGWYAAVQVIRRSLKWPFLGVGPGRFNQAVQSEYGSVGKPAGNTDIVAGFNIDTSEPDSFNMYLVTCAEAGPLALVALVWIGVLFLGRSVRSQFLPKDDFGRALTLGAAGAVAGAALCAVFSSILVRGVALPFIFVALSGILWARLPGSSDEAGAGNRGLFTVQLLTRVGE